MKVFKASRVPCNGIGCSDLNLVMSFQSVNLSPVGDLPNCITRSACGMRKIVLQGCCTWNNEHWLNLVCEPQIPLIHPYHSRKVWWITRKKSYGNPFKLLKSHKIPLKSPWNPIEIHWNPMEIPLKSLSFTAIHPVPSGRAKKRLQAQAAWDEAPEAPCSWRSR